MTHPHRIVAVAALLVFSSACDEIASSDLFTEDMSAEIGVFADGDGSSTAEVLLRQGDIQSLVFVELTGADVLTASLGDEDVIMQGVDLAALHRYDADFDSAVADGTYTFSLTRDVDDGAPSSTVSLPEPFDLGTLASTLTATEDLAITWTPADSADAMSVRIEGSCILTFREDIPTDAGTWTVDAGDLELVDDTATDGCTLEVRLIRTRAGSLDTGFGEGGEITAQQLRSASVTFTP